MQEEVAFSPSNELFYTVLLLMPAFPSISGCPHSILLFTLASVFGIVHVSVFFVHCTSSAPWRAPWHSCGNSLMYFLRWGFGGSIFSVV